MRSVRGLTRYALLATHVLLAMVMASGACVALSSCGGAEQEPPVAPAEQEDVQPRSGEATIFPYEGGYDDGNVTFYLPASLGDAEFVREPRVEDFSLSDESISIVGVDYDPTIPDEVTLRIDATSAGSARETFAALDAALTQGGVAVAADATNSGAIRIGSDEMRAAEQAGYEVTALSCVEVRPAAFVEAVHAVEGEEKDGADPTSYEVRLKTQITCGPGFCTLPDEGLDRLVKVDALDGSGGAPILEGAATRLEDARLYLDMRLPSDVAEALSGATGRNALVAAQPLVAELARAHKLVLGEGVLCNAWGVDEPTSEVPIFITRDLSQAGAPGRLSYAEQHELIESGAETATTADGPADGEVLELIRATDKELASLQDMVAWIDSMGEGMRTVDAMLDQLSSQLVGAEKRLGSYEELSSMRALVARTELYGSVPKADARGIATIQSAYGLDAASDTMKLGELIPSVIERYDACVDAALTWKPACTMSHRLLVTQLKYAYLCGYVAARQQGVASEALDQSYRQAMDALR